MNKHYIQKIINEQFNIQNMDFDNIKKRNNNIFNKEMNVAKIIYDKILNDEYISEDDILCINNEVSKVKVDTLLNLKTIIIFYADRYRNCSLNWLDVSGITNMSLSFGNQDYIGDISQWDVSNVKNMADMFLNSSFNGDISNWDVSNVEDMSGMFAKSQFNGDISGWDVSNVKYMKCMFDSSVFNRDISNWNVSNVEDMQCMFFDSKFNHDISMWNVSNVYMHAFMFEKCPIRQKYKPAGLW